MNRFDVVVVGGGIAGLAAAEMLVRNRRSVCLVEQHPQIGLGASGDHHEWFHFGSLYSIFPCIRYQQALLSGVASLIKYYAGFSGMNVRIAPTGRLAVDDRPGTWFRQDRINYIVAAPNDPGFRRAAGMPWWSALSRPALGLMWNLQIKQFICRHNRFYAYDWRRARPEREIPTYNLFNYSRRNIEKWRNPDIRLDSQSHFLISGYDRPMETRSILGDLLCSFLAGGGVLRLGERFESYQRGAGGLLAIELSGGTIESASLVLASGAGLSRHASNASNASNASHAVRFRQTASPLLVVYPAVCGENMVRLTPFMDETLCHLRHYMNGAAYSVIGSGYAAPADDHEALAAMSRQLTARAAATFPRMADATIVETYCGTKMERVRQHSTRNYDSSILPIDDRVWAILPGKFSLGFGLAVKTFHTLTGHLPEHTPSIMASAAAPYNSEIDKLLGWVRHKRIIQASFAGAGP